MKYAKRLEVFDAKRAVQQKIWESARCIELRKLRKLHGRDN